MNAQDVVNACRSDGVELIRFIYCDFTGVQRGKITAVDDLANRLSHGINLTRAQMAFTLLDTVVNIRGMEPVGELRMLPDPDTFSVLPWLPSHASMTCDLVESDGQRYCKHAGADWPRTRRDESWGDGLVLRSHFFRGTAAGKWL